MKNSVAKRLRKAALSEMVMDGVPKQDLVWGKNSVINSPQSVRAMYLRMKQAWKRIASSAGQAKHIVARIRKGSNFHRKNTLETHALIQSPLKQLAHLFPPTKNLRGEMEHSPIYVRAARAAKAGHGATVQRIARSYI